MKEFVLSYDALAKLKEHGRSLADIDTKDLLDLALLYYACSTEETTLDEVLSRLMAKDIDITVAELFDDMIQKGKKKQKK